MNLEEFNELVTDPEYYINEYFNPIIHQIDLHFESTNQQNHPVRFNLLEEIKQIKKQGLNAFNFVKDHVTIHHIEAIKLLLRCNSTYNYIVNAHGGYIQRRVKMSGFTIAPCRLTFSDLFGLKYDGDFEYIYIGQFELGWMNGFGKLYLNNKQVYEGEFVQNRKHGYGEETFEDSIYKGEFVQGYMQGFGTIYFNTGCKVEGMFMKGKMTKFILP